MDSSDTQHWYIVTHANGDRTLASAVCPVAHDATSPARIHTAWVGSAQYTAKHDNVIISVRIRLMIAQTFTVNQRIYAEIDAHNDHRIAAIQ